MLDMYNVIKSAHMTEKSVKTSENTGKVVLKVDVKANKSQIKEAVERLYGVKVSRVNTHNYEGKSKKFGAVLGRRKNWKKAIVSLESEKTLELV